MNRAFLSDVISLETFLPRRLLTIFSRQILDYRDENISSHEIEKISSNNAMGKFINAMTSRDT